MYRPRSGERVMIEVLLTGDVYPGEVRSVADDPSLVVCPEARGVELPLPGCAVRITFVRKDGLYEEHGEITRLIEGPEPNLNVALTGEALRTQRRDHVRMDASLNADVELGDQHVKCVTKDVSGGGVSLLFRESPPLQEGDEFGVTLNVPDGRLPIRARCETKFVREVLRGSRWLVGSQFVTLAEEDRQRIVQFVFRLELTHRRPR